MAQNTLDKRIRFFERKYGTELSIDIESSAAHNHDPNKFWNYIKRLEKICFLANVLKTEKYMLITEL